MFPHNSDNLPSVSHVRFSTTACIFSEQLFRFVTPENIAITDKAVRFTFVCLRIREGLLRGEFLQWLISVSMGMPLMADLILTTTLIITLSRSRSSFMRWVKLHSGINLAERVSL